MAAARLARTPSKRWVDDSEVPQCPLCANRFEGNFLDITISGRTHCRYCGGVFCTNCCSQELYMPEDEVVRPPSSAKFKSIIFDPTLKQKACRTCVKILLPKQEAIKASRGRGASGRLNGFVSRKNPPGPYFSIVIVKAKALRGSRANAEVADPVCLLTVGNTSSITQPTESGSDPVWDQSFDFPVDSEHGNSLKLTCYEEDSGGKVLIGEGSTKVVETGADGAWVPVTDERRAVTGEVLVRCTFKGARSSRAVSSSGTVQGKGLPATYELDSEDNSSHPVPVLHWLQEKAWLVYVVLLLASVLYRFSSNRGFSGQSIVLPKGVRTDVNVPKRSDTHFIKLHKDGNLVLREGKPGDGVVTTPYWESGPVQKGCAKCTFMLDEKGQRLVVSTRRGKEVVSFSVADDKLLNAAIKTR